MQKWTTKYVCFWSATAPLISQLMDSFKKGLHSAARASVKTSLSVCLALLEGQNLFYRISQILGPVPQSFQVLHHTLLNFEYLFLFVT